MHIKSTLRFHLTLVRIAIIKTPPTTNAGKNVGKREPSYTPGRNVNLYNFSGKQNGGFLKN
jgi:hypothetical protein